MTQELIDSLKKPIDSSTYDYKKNYNTERLWAANHIERIENDRKRLSKVIEGQRKALIEYNSPVNDPAVEYLISWLKEQGVCHCDKGRNRCQICKLAGTYRRLINSVGTHEDLQSKNKKLEKIVDNVIVFNKNNKSDYFMNCKCCGEMKLKDDPVWKIIISRCDEVSL